MSAVVDYDKILTHIGSYGRSQKLLTCVLFYLRMQLGFQFFSAVLIFYEPGFRCSTSSHDSLNSSEFKYCHEPNCAQCFISDVTSCVGEDCAANSTTVKCNDFMFDDSVVKESIITEYYLVCDRASLKHVSESLFLFGYLLGSFVFGDLADRYGRRVVLFYATLGAAVCSFVATFSTNLYVFSIAKMFLSTFCVGSANSSYIYIAELIGVNRRTFVGLTIEVGNAFGYIAAIGIFYAFPSHFYLQLIGSVMLIPACILLFFLPESPRWLISVQRQDDAIQVAKKLANFNSTKVDDEVWESFKEDSPTTEDKYKKKFSYIDLFKTRTIAILTSKSLILWFTYGFIYTGIVYNIDSLSGNMFVNHLISSVVDLLACIFCGFVLISVGRRKFQFVTTIVTAISLLLSTIFTHALTQETGWLIRGLSFIARFGSMTNYTVIYIYTAELYPTVIRSVGVNSGALSANLGSTIVQYVLFMQSFVWWLPNISFAALMCISAAIHFTLPETKTIKLMQTIEDAKIFYA